VDYLPSDQFLIRMAQAKQK